MTLDDIAHRVSGRRAAERGTGQLWLSGARAQPSSSRKCAGGAGAARRRTRRRRRTRSVPCRVRLSPWASATGADVDVGHRGGHGRGDEDGTRPVPHRSTVWPNCSSPWATRSRWASRWPESPLAQESTSNDRLSVHGHTAGSTMHSWPRPCATSRRASSHRCAAKHDEEHSASRTRWWTAWPRWACSACRSPRSTAAWAATTSRCAWPWRSWARWTRAWPSPWRPASRWARCRCTGSEMTRRSRNGCRCWPAVRRSARSGSPRRAAAATPGPPRRRAKADGGRLGHQRLQAKFITNSRHRHHQAGHRHRRHRGDRAPGKKEISSILVPVPTEGFTAEPAYNKVGWNASDTHPLSFDDVRVPAGEPAG